MAAKESLLFSAMYITLGIIFGGFFWSYLGQQADIEYITGFVVEKNLAIDNMFVIALILTYFGIPQEYQHRVLCT